MNDSKDLGVAVAMYEGELAKARAEGNLPATGKALRELAMLCRATGDFERARHYLNDSLQHSRELDAERERAAGLYQYGRLAQDVGNHTQARELYEESLALHRRLDSPLQVAQTLHQLGRLAEDEGRLNEALDLALHSLDMLVELRSPNVEVAKETVERIQGKLQGSVR